jgi:hypothetical protein
MKKYTNIILSVFLLLLSFEKDALPLFKQYCILCHNENTGGRMRNFLKYEVAVEFKDSIKAKLLDQSMPLPGARINMPEEDRQILIDWIDQGANP